MNETTAGEALQCAHANLNHAPAARRMSRGRGVVAAQRQRPLEHRGVTPTLNSVGPLAATVTPVWVSGSALPGSADSFRAGLLIPLALTRLIKMDL